MSFELGRIATEAQTGYKEMAENTLTTPCWVALFPAGISFATEAAAKTKSNWVTLLKAAEPNRVKILPVAKDCTPLDEEDTIEPQPFKGGALTVRGKKGFSYFINANLWYQQELLNLMNKEWYMIYGDDNDNYIGMSSDNIKFEPIKVTSLVVRTPKTPEAKKNELVQIDFTLSKTNFLTTRKAITELTWSPKDELDGVTKVVVAVSGNWSATGGAVSVKELATGKSISGLLYTDFAIPGKSITVATYDASTELYTITSSGLTTLLTIDLLACGSITGVTTIYVESTGASAFTIP